MRRGWLRAGIAAALFAGGAALVYTMPTEESLSSPIEVRTSVGVRADGYAFDARVERVRLADRLVLSDGSVVRTPGVFVVVSAWVLPHLLSADLSRSSGGVNIRNSTLRTGGATYSAYLDPTDRDLSGGFSFAGIPVRGTLAFEVPRSVLAEHDAEIVLDRGQLTPETIIVVPFDPSELTPSPQVRSSTTRLVARSGS